MAWRYPPYNLEDGQVVDVDDANDIFFAFAEEVNGSLDAQNVEFEGLSRASDLSDDVAFKVYQDEREVAGNDRTATPANTFVVPKGEKWEGIPDTEMYISAQGVLWIIGSLQIGNTGVYGGSRVAVRVDGEVIPESVVPTLDMSEDGPNILLTSNAGYSGNTATALMALSYQPVVTEAIVPVFGGRHIVDLAIQVSDSRFYNAEVKVFSREIIVLEAS